MKKYEFTGKTKQYFGTTLRQIVAVMDFGGINAGDVGGWIENENNLSHEGDAWVYGDAKVYGNAVVCGNARVYGNAEVWGDARVYGDAKVYGNAVVCGNAGVYAENQVLVIGAIGSRGGFTTFYRDKDNEITVKCGCFAGKIEEFLRKVSQTHGNNRHAMVYREAAEFAKVSIELSPEKNKKEGQPGTAGD